MKLQVIQLEPYDDVTSVRDRLTFVQSERVLLVWPRRAQILRRKLDLVLIQRETARRGARLALVTDDLNVIDHARELNISTFFRPEDSYRAQWKRPLNKVFVDRSDRPIEAPDPYELRLTASRLRRLTPQQRHLRRVVRGGSLVALVLVLFFVGFLLIPNAEVTVYPAQRQINTTIRLVADPSITQINVETGHVPAVLQVIEIATRASIPTTGSVDVPNTLASGTVTFINQTDNPVFIPAGTVVMTFGLNPAKFRTVSDITLDGGVDRSIDVIIEALAESGGPEGNIDSNLIAVVEGPLKDSLAVRNDKPTQGGTIRQQSVVTKADQDNLLLLAREKVRQVALTEFSSKLSGTQFIAPDSIKIVGDESVSYSSFVNDQTNTLTIDIRASVQAVVIDEQLAKQAALASLSRKIPQGQQISPQSVTFTRGAIQPTDANEQVSFFMSASGNIAVAINPDQIRQRLAGASLTDAPGLLERDLLLDPRRPPQIKMWPELLQRLPALPIRITVRIVD